MAEHSIVVAHCIPLSNNVLIKKLLIMEETELHPNNVRMLLKPVTHSAKGRKKNALFKPS
jgi:hypothetical protein